MATKSFQDKVRGLQSQGLEMAFQWHWSCASEGQEPTFRGLIEVVGPTRIVEIGTHEGLSAGLLAEYGEVTTVDIFPGPNERRARLWKALKVDHRITEEVHRDQQGRDDAIRKAVKGAQLAFIDGSHLLRDVAYDFQLTESCGAVIFHDYWLSVKRNEWPDVRTFVDSLDQSKYAVTIQRPFALVQPV